MKTAFRNNLIRRAILIGSSFGLALSPAFSITAFAQQNDPGPVAAGPLPSDGQSGTWRRLGGQPVSQQPPQAILVPGQLNIPAGAFLTIRTDQVLSSNRSQQGDTFSATLVKPLVVDGFVVADRGQTITGRVAEALKSGKIKGQSSLAVELMEVTLVDGQQMPVRTQLVAHSGGSNQGRDAAAVVTTAGVGAAIGAAAGSGRGNIGAGPGAAAGAGAGALAAAIGVLLTRGRETIIDPETLLTFRIEQPITINTTRAPQAFRTVTQGDYSQPQDRPRPSLQTAQPRSYYGGFGYPGYGWPGFGWPGYGWGYPSYGPSIGIGIRYGGGFGRYGGGYRGGFGGGHSGRR